MKLITNIVLLSAFLLLVGCCGDKQEKSMSITVNLRYTGIDGNARKFAAATNSTTIPLQVCAPTSFRSLKAALDLS